MGEPVLLFRIPNQIFHRLWDQSGATTPKQFLAWLHLRPRVMRDLWDMTEQSLDFEENA